uniref:Uncharacterized protein n=1 Tax=Arundo donax TaxID=35708 RepID=A0A0A9EKG3_ARUDO
MLSSLTSSRRA